MVRWTGLSTNHFLVRRFVLSSPHNHSSMANDKLLPSVKAALLAAGWTIKEGAITIRKAGYQFQIDVSADKDGEKVAIEVKSWLSNFVYDWHQALGQYLTYYALLFKKDPDRVLYLAVPEDVYKEHFINELFQEFTALYSVNLFIFNQRTNSIVSWKRQ